MTVVVGGDSRPLVFGARRSFRSEPLSLDVRLDLAQIAVGFRQIGEVMGRQPLGLQEARMESAVGPELDLDEADDMLASVGRQEPV